MNLPLVARQSLRESVRGNQFTVLVAMFAIVFGAIGLLVGGMEPGDAGTLQDLLLVAASLVVPLVGLLLGQPTVAARRDDGRLRLVLGLPISRASFVLGSYVASVAVLSVAVVAGLVVTLVAHAVLGGVLVPDYIATLAGGTILLGTAYLGLALGVSAASTSTKWATLNMLGVYLLLVGLWRIVPYFGVFVANGASFPDELPAWVDLLSGLSPSVAFERLFGFHGVEFFEASHYTSTAFSVAVLAGWIVLVPLPGLVQFLRSDL